MIDNLDRIVKISEYRQIQELLEPISIVSDKLVRRARQLTNQRSTTPILWLQFTNTSKWKVDFAPRWKTSIDRP